MIADIVESLGIGERPRLVELGKIKIGGLGQARQARTGTGTYRQPRKDDHFTITTLQRGAEVGGARGDLIEDKALMQSLMPDYADKHDGKLRQIPIRVLSDDIEDILQVAWVWYGRKSCGARTDGKTVTWFYDPQTNQPYDPPFTEPFKPEILDWTIGNGSNPPKMFKLHSVFNCVIAAKDARWGGVYKFRTTSVISFKQLYSSLVHLSQLTGGVLTNMPLVLKVRPLPVAPNGQASTVHVVHVELMGSELFEIQKQALLQAEFQTKYRQRLLSTQHQYQKLLVAPGEEMNGEAGAVADEFAPEAQDLGAPAAPENGYDLLAGDDESAPPENPPAAPVSSDPASHPAGESDEQSGGGLVEESNIGGDEPNAAPEAPKAEEQWPDVLPAHALDSDAWISDAIATFKPSTYSSARAARKAFNAADGAASWKSLGAERKQEKYTQIKNGTFPWPNAASVK